MKLLFRILKSSFTDKLAYLSAVAAALCWLVRVRYPALFPVPLKETAHIYMTIAASLAAGMLIAKYVFREGYLRSAQEVRVEKEAFADRLKRLEAVLEEAKEEKTRISERESVLKNKLKSFETGATEAQLSSLRKKIRQEEEDRKTALALLLHDLRNRLKDLDDFKDREMAHAAAVLKKETDFLENEIKKGERSLCELVLKISEIREHTFDLAWIRVQAAGGPEEGARDSGPPRNFPWFSQETDPSRVERVYKFLRVAFHPDRFSSERLKEEAKIHFQEAVQAYNTLKERFRTTH